MIEQGGTCQLEESELGTTTHSLTSST
jgi:hypothetical protein